MPYIALESHELVSALRNSSLVNLKLEILGPGHTNMTKHISSLLDAFQTNTMLTHLIIQIRYAVIGVEHIVQLLTKNSTLETLKLEGISIIQDGIDDERLKSISTNETLTDVWPGAPSLMRQVAERNKRNKLMRDARLFGLTSHVMY